MQDNEFYAPPNSSLERGPSTESKKYGVWQRFYITFLWGVPIYMIFVMLGTPAESWGYGAVGSVVFSIGSGIIAMFIPVHYKSVFATAGILLGIITAGVIGTYFG